MKFYEVDSFLNYSWEQVVTSYWNRYPNPFSKHVLSEDTLKREVQHGKLTLVRFLVKTGAGIPRWAERFVPHKHVSIIEESVTDPANQKLVTYTRNIGLSKIMSVVEKVEYTSDPHNPQQTLVRRKAWIESQFHVPALRRPIEAFGYERFRKNCIKALNGFQWVLSKMWTKDSSPLTNQVNLNDLAKEAARRASTLASSSATLNS